MSDEKTTDPVATIPTAAPTPKIPRTRDEIRVEYTNTAAQAGNLAFQIKLMEQQLNQMYFKLDALGAEEAALPPEAKAHPAPRLVPQPPKAGSDGT